ncbi:N-6 DNA methylase, partial [Bacteroides uniformis]
MAFNRKQRLRDNIEAIRTAFLLDREQRTPTARERLLLERYCGFGGLKSILNPARELTDAVHWAKSDLELFAPTVELHRLLRENTKDETEYKRYMDAMKQSVLTAFYTPPEITGTIADVLHEHGIRPDRVLEPSAGVGAFVDAVLENRPDADIMAFEKDLMTGKILKHLHPGQKVRVQGFEKIEKPFMNHFDLAVSNIPFGDVAVFDPEFSGSKDPARHSAARTIHNYFFLKSLDAVREGGIVAFITSQGVLDAPTNAPIREYMMNHTNLVGVARLPNNLFTDNAGTEVGSDLIILQKNSGKNGELYYNEKLFVQTEQTPIGTSVNGYVWSIGSLSHTDLIRSTDPYGKPAYKLLHRGDIAQLAEDLREHLKIELQQLDRKLYEKHSLHPTKEESTAAEVQPAPKTEKVSPSVIAPVSVIEPVKGVEKPQAQPIEEKPEIEPRQPNHSSAVQLTLLDLWGMPIEEPAKKKKAAKKESKPKPMPSTPKPQVKVTPPVEAAKPVNGNKEEKPENAEKPNDPDDIYATLDWETNPPINGFYETMMSLTAERRKALRLEAERHRQEQLKKMGIKDTLNPAFAPSSDNMDKKPEQTEEIKQPETPAEVVPTSETVATSLFPEFETEKPKKEALDLTPRPYHRTPEMHLREGSLVANRARDIGYLKDITPYGATFQPLGLTGYQKEKALLYVSLRDAYERLYRYESNRREENVPWREHLNTCYDEFVMRYGNLNAKQNVKLVMMDAGGRDILSLERAEDGKFVKADIFDRPVSFSVENHANVGSPEEALSASLNKYGTVNLNYMRGITDSTEEELLNALKGRIFYNPLVTGYEIKDRFIAGNVIEKAERIEAWMENNLESKRLPEVKQALEALKEAEPQRIAFEDLDFNFGERWIPTGVYAAYMSHLFDT